MVELPYTFLPKKGYLDIVRFLTKGCKCDVELKDKKGRTPLYIAFIEDHLSIVKYLTKECKYDIEANNNFGDTPLHIASLDGYLDFVQYLTEECHADITARIISDAKNDEINKYL